MILGVDYRHKTLPTAYVRVGGHDELSAEQKAKRLCSILKERLDDAIVAMPRMLDKRQRGMRVFEIPVTVGGSLEEAEQLVTEALDGSS